MKWLRYITAAALAGAVGLASPMAAMASGPDFAKGEEEEERLSPPALKSSSPEFARTEEEWARLRDDVIEYDELADLIHEYNATVQNNQYEYKKFREDYGDTNEEVSREYYNLAQDFYSDMSGDDDAGSLMADLNLQIQADNMMRQADETLEDSRIYLLTYEQAEMSLAASAQSEMISYHKKLLERCQKEAELHEAQESYSLAQTKLSAGTSTQLDVLTAKEQMQAKENELAGLDSSIQNAKEGLFILLGWKHSDHPVIGELPETDLGRIDGMDPDADLGKAVENNYTRSINKRKLENAKDQTTRDSLTDTIANNEKQIGSSLSNAYKAVLSAKLSYEQALAQEQLEAENSRIAAGKLEAGIITQREHKEQVNKVERARMDAEMASMTLFEKMEAYDWSVRGLATAQ